MMHVENLKNFLKTVTLVENIYFLQIRENKKKENNECNDVEVMTLISEFWDLFTNHKEN